MLLGLRGSGLAGPPPLETPHVPQIVVENYLQTAQETKQIIRNPGKYSPGFVFTHPEVFPAHNTSYRNGVLPLMLVALNEK